MICKGETIWIFGRAGSGKSTNAMNLVKAARAKKESVIYLDGDVVRAGITNDCGFDKKGIEKNITRIVQICKVINDQGIDVVASFITPFEKLREYIAGSLDYPTLIYMNTSVETCYERRKDLYDTGKVMEFEEPSDESKYRYFIMKGE